MNGWGFILFIVQLWFIWVEWLDSVYFFLVSTGEGAELQDRGPEVGVSTSDKGAQVTEADLSGQQDSPVT